MRSKKLLLIESLLSTPKLQCDSKKLDEDQSRVKLTANVINEEHIEPLIAHMFVE